MKCEKCEQELSGGAVICRQCGFNNALQRLGGWRAKQGLPAHDRAGQATPRRPHDATLIPFPVSPHQAKSSETTKEGHPEASPLWRQRLEETIREIRERRAETHQRQALAPPLEPNPIVEAAVKRLQRDATPSSSAMPHSTGQAGQATARAIQCDDDPELSTEPRLTAPPPYSAKHPAPADTVAAKPVTRTAGLPQARATHQPVRPTSIALSATTLSSENKPDQAAAERRAHAAEATAHAVEDEIVFSGAAPLLARAAANAIDVAIITLSYLPFLTAFTLFEAEFSRWSLYILATIAVAAIFCYHLLTVAIAGRTSGMALCKLRLVDAASERIPPTLAQAFGRAFGATLSLLLLPLNLLVILLSLERLSLSDYLSGTVIVRQ